MPEGKKEGLEGRVISLILLALVIVATVWVLRKNAEVKKEKALRVVAEEAATAVRSKLSSVEAKADGLALANEDLADIVKAFDEAPPIFTNPEKRAKTDIINPGETYRGDSVKALLDPKRLAECATALVKLKEANDLKAEAETNRDTYKELYRLENIRAIKLKGKLPIAFLAGAVTTGVVWIVATKPWK